MRKICVLAVVMVVLTACNSSDKLFENEAVGYIQGTTYQIKYLSAEPMDLQSDFDNIFREIDQSMSTYLPNSYISRLNRGDKAAVPDENFMTVLKRSLEIARETEGYFDPSVGPLVKLWGFGQSKAKLSDIQPRLDSVISLVGYDRITVSGNNIRMPEAYQVDFNAIAQGFTVDLIADYLNEKGVSNYMVEIGGEVRASGVNISGKPWIIGIDKPSEEIDQQDRFQVIVSLENQSLATSGNYRKFWIDEETGARYAHTINPHTGMPARNSLLSVSVIAPSCADADAYATAFMAMGAERAWEFVNAKPKLDAYFVIAAPSGGWQIRMTEGFKQQVKQDPSS